MVVRWVELNGRYASVLPPAMQRQEGDGDNPASPVGMVDCPCINVQPGFRPLHVVYPVVRPPEVSTAVILPTSARGYCNPSTRPLPIHIPSGRAITIHRPKPTHHSVDPVVLHSTTDVFSPPSLVTYFNFSFDLPDFSPSSVFEWDRQS